MRSYTTGDVSDKMSLSVVLLMAAEITKGIDVSTEKEGLQASIEFTKMLIALSGGAIAFILQPLIGAASVFIGGLSLIALLFLAMSVISGLFVISGAAVMLGRKDYNLESPYVKYPGLINVFSFAAGFLLLALLVAIRIFGNMT